MACLVAMAAVVLALAGGYIIRPTISDETFFWVFYPSMVILALLGGLLPGLLAAQRADTTLAESDRKFMHDRQMAEAALRESEARFRTLSESMPQLVWTATPDGQNDYANSRWEQYTGLSRNELSGERWAEVLHPEDRERAILAWSAAVHSPTAQYDLELRMRGSDGVYRWFKVRGERVLSSDGKVVKWIGTCTDIDYQKRVQEELSRAKTAVEEVSRAKDEFLAVLSHELRTPLSPVLLSASALEHQRDLPEEIRSELAMIRRNVELECRLIDDLLDLTRIARNKLPLNMQSVNMHQLVQETLRICHDDIVARRLHVALHLDADVHRVHGDPTRLQQVLWNLVKNACKFTPESGSITIRTFATGLPGDHDGQDAGAMDGSATKDRPEIHVEVADTGVGISAEALPRIFDAFEQGSHGTTRQFGGLGLGLAISRKLAQMHGGTLMAASAGSNQGSTFTLTLPVQVGRSSPTYQEFPDLAAQETQEPAESGVTRRVLLVEDHADTARVMARLLESLNCRVSVAHTVAEALDLASRETYDLVVSDLGLPDASGHELMRRLRVDHHDLRGIALSGYGMEEDIRRSMEAGFIDHLIKPIQFDQLRTVLSRVTAGETVK